MEQILSILSRLFLLNSNLKQKIKEKTPNLKDYSEILQILKHLENKQNLYLESLSFKKVKELNQKLSLKKKNILKKEERENQIFDQEKLKQLDEYLQE
jgi:hypothetical protein